MPTKREYLVDLGLAQSRGKYSNVAKEALEAATKNGIVFDEPIVGPVVSKAVAKIKQTAAMIEERTEYRTNTVMYGWDKVVEAFIAFDTCATCTKHIKYCSHDLPHLPKWLESPVYWEMDHAT